MIQSHTPVQSGTEENMKYYRLSEDLQRPTCHGRTENHHQLLKEGRKDGRKEGRKEAKAAWDGDEEVEHIALCNLLGRGKKTDTSAQTGNVIL
jgi:hypothetical protein